MISVPINKRAALNLLNLKLNDKMSNAFMSYIYFDGKNVKLDKKNVDELKQLATIVNEIIINYNDQQIQH